jgi:hypothetical protein
MYHENLNFRPQNFGISKQGLVKVSSLAQKIIIIIVVRNLSDVILREEHPKHILPSWHLLSIHVIPILNRRLKESGFKLINH